VGYGIYKHKYRELAHLLHEEGCYVLDSDYLGYCLVTEEIKSVIYIKSTLSWKNKLHVLAHETGHLFKPLKGSPLSLEWGKVVAPEETANYRALQILNFLGVSHEYLDFYEKTRGRRVRKPWHQD
jgi:Zn-dependent peptidase ImmA (M78 family)